MSNETEFLPPEEFEDDKLGRMFAEDYLNSKGSQIKSKEQKPGEAFGSSESKDTKATNSDLVKQSKQADELVSIALDEGVEFFLDQYREPFCILPHKPVEGHSIRSSTFKRWLSAIYWERKQKGITSETFSQVIAALEGRASYLNDRRELYNRIAYVNDEIWYDIGDGLHAVHITKNGWELKEESGVVFQRFSHQNIQDLPAETGDLHDILQYVNLRDLETSVSMTKNVSIQNQPQTGNMETTETYSDGTHGIDGNELLLLTYLVAVMFPDIPRALLVAVGQQGSAKSTLLKIIRMIIDPSRTPLLQMRSSTDELALMASHHYCLYLDNLSYLSNASSDSLAGFTTGLGFTKRKLFSDAEDIIFELKVAVGINGIALVAERADLLDRCLIFELERIADDKREEEKPFFKKFEKNKPKILAGLFDILSKTLKLIPTIELSSKPRMADYAKVGAAASVALGYTAENFIAAYKKNVGRQNAAAVESSAVAQAIMLLMADLEQKEPKVNEWSDSSSSLFSTLDAIVASHQLTRGGSDGFPKSAKWLWRKILLVKTNLLALGYSIVRGHELANNTITISKVLPVPTEDDSNDSMSPKQPQKGVETNKNDSNDVSNEEPKKIEEAIEEEIPF